MLNLTRVLSVCFAVVMMSMSVSQAQEKNLGKYSDFTPFQEKWLTTEPKEPTEDWLISYGGRLYDKWFVLVDRGSPAGNHPAYPKSSKQSGPETWRCKACHGWDYKGKDGAYGDPENSNYTGIKGVRQWMGKEPKDVVKILRDETHQFNERVLPKYAAERIALFLTKGQHDTFLLIDEKGQVKGSAEKGKPVFQNLCAVCHGYDGRSINFASGAKEKYLGTVAASNPWETIHKMRNGHPGAIMPSQRWVPLNFIADVAAYAQTLPIK